MAAGEEDTSTRTGRFRPGTSNDAPVIIYGSLAAVLFSSYFIVHLFQVARYRTMYLVTLPTGLGFEIVGYVARCLSAKQNPYKLALAARGRFLLPSSARILLQWVDGHSGGCLHSVKLYNESTKTGGISSPSA